MEKKIIQANPDNDFKYRDGLYEDPKKKKPVDPNNKTIEEQTTTDTEQLQYFTE